MNVAENQKEEFKKKVTAICEKLKEVPYKEEDKKFMRECQICQEAFEVNEKVSLLPCDERHYFHTVCTFKLISTAIEEGKPPQCPLFKIEIDKNQPQKENEEGNTGGREEPLLNDNQNN